jgi:FkbM family methyltransferase
MKKIIQKMLPKQIYNFLLNAGRKYRNWRYSNQEIIKIKHGSYDILVPQKHPIIEFKISQPYRDLCVGISAKYISMKYPSGTIIDIGANIGDTALILASYSKNDLILVEASDYFFDILEQNITQLPNKVTAIKSLISDGTNANGFFVHWGGTASFIEKNEGYSKLPTKRLSDIANHNVCFIKTDTDGYDFKILADSLEYLALAHSAILFENQIRTTEDLSSSNDLLLRLMEIGYLYFIVWDDPGFYLTSTTSIDVLTDLNRYLFKTWDNPLSTYKRICNYDILCLHKNDEDIYQNICDFFRSY